MPQLNTKLAQLYNFSLRKQFDLLPRLIEAYRFSRPFKAGSKRILIVLEPNPISFSQVYPFFFYETELQRRWDVQIRAQSRRSIENGTTQSLRGADVILLQTWFDLDADAKQGLFTQLRQAHPHAQIVYLDWFAPLDLRLAELMNEDICLYVKKQFFRDPTEYGRATHGDTNLMNFYGSLYGIDYPETTFPIPDGFLSKTIVGPGFFTADYMLTAFQKPEPPPQERPIDLHARLGTKGSAWYEQMRSHALSAATDIDGIRIATGPGKNRSGYLQELASTKICFSPFGYGEVCWRDYEAIMCGSLLLKPDMSHAQTSPDIFAANETYVPVRWDFSDVEDKIRYYLANADERQRIVEKAYNVIHDYVSRGRFVDQVAPIFELAG